MKLAGYRLAYRRSGRPKLAAAVEEVAECKALKARCPDQRELRMEFRARDADACCRRGEQPLGTPDVGTLPEQVRGQVRGKLGCDDRDRARLGDGANNEAMWR
jgi:hypothetical protein